MIADPNDPDRPRSLLICITDLGDSWDVDIARNRISAVDDDVCSLIAEFGSVLDQLHRESHIAKGLLERRN